MIPFMSQTSTHSNAPQTLREAIQKVAVGPDRGRDISQADAQLICEAMLDGELDELQVAVFLIALRMKRESMGEMCGLFLGLVSRSQRQSVEVDELFCLADPFDGYSRHNSVTAFIAPTLAACGLPTVMHGVHTIGPKHGVTAHQVYRLAGINPLIGQAGAAENISRFGWSYIDQEVYAPALYVLANLRDRMVKRTALTTLERVLMPFQGRVGTHLVLGYVHQVYPEIYINMARLAGFTSATLVKGVEGGLAPALNKPIRRFHQSELVGSESAPEKQIVELPSVLEGQTLAAPRSAFIGAQQCLEQGMRVLAGEASVARDSLCLSVANILHSHNRTNSLAEAVEKVQDCLDNGSAMARFTQVCESA